MPSRWWPPTKLPGIAIVRAAARSWSEHRTIRFGAGLAYYWLFAFVPLAVVALTIAALLFPVEEVLEYLLTRLGGTGGSRATEQIAAIVADWVADALSVQVGVVGVVVALVSASFALAATQDALNVIWEVRKKRGVEVALRRRALALVAAIAVASVLVVVLLASAIMSGIQSLLPGDLLLGEILADIAGIAAPFAVGSGLVILLYRMLPDVSVPWTAATIAGVLATAGIAIGTRLFWWYFTATSGPSLASAAAGAFAILAWMYVVAQVFLGGGELSRAIAVWPDPTGPSLALDRSDI